MPAYDSSEGVKAASAQSHSGNPKTESAGMIKEEEKGNRRRFVFASTTTSNGVSKVISKILDFVSVCVIPTD